MNKTEHYNLNQWDKSDRIMMEDFNRDNANLDAAIQAEATARLAGAAALEAAIAAKPAFEMLRTVTTSAQAQIVELDISNISLAQYFYIIVVSKMNGSAYFQAYLNSIGGDVSSYFPGQMNTGRSCFAYGNAGDVSPMLLTPRKEGGYLAETIFKGQLGLGLGNYRSLTWGNVKKLIWYAPESGAILGAGSRITIWGVK